MLLAALWLCLKAVEGSQSSVGWRWQFTTSLAGGGHDEGGEYSVCSDHNRLLQTLFRTCVQQAWWWAKTCTIRYAKHTDQFFKDQSCTGIVKYLPFMPTAKFSANLTDNSAYIQHLQVCKLPFVMNFFHWCLVRYQTVAGTRRFLAGLFIFLSRSPVDSQLRASGRNWFRNIIMNTTAKKVSFLFWLLWHYAELWNVVSPACKWTVRNQ